MMEIIAMDMAPIMFASLVIFLLLGYPVAFSLAANGLVFFVIGVWLAPVSEGQITLDWPLLYALPERFWGVMQNDTLLAIPFFTFMGVVLEKSGLAEDLMEGFGQLFGPVPGGIAYAVIFVGAILGAITGTVAASGTITQVIPPSLVLIVLAFQLGVPVGDMYIGAIGPSIAQVSLFAGFIFLVSIFQPHKVPALPPEARTLRGMELASKLAWGMVPSLVLIFLVLGTIFMGLATPTEAGAMGAVGAILLAVAHRRFSWNMVWLASDGTMRITAMVIFILVGATVFSLVFQGVNGGKWIEHMLEGIPGGRIGFLIFVNIFIFFIAFFLDFFEIVFIVVPLLIPTAVALDIDLVWLGVLLCVNMQTAFMHPPFGFALFYLRGIAPPEVKSRDIYLGSIPWIILQLILVALIITFPGIVDSFIAEEVLLDAATVTEQLDLIPMPDLELPALDLDLGPAVAPAPVTP